MKKISKILLKSFTLVFAVMFAGFSFIGCSNSKSKTAVPAATEITDTTNTTENAETTTEEDNETSIETEETEELPSENETEQETIIDFTTLDGIYQITKTITFDDADRTNADEVITYFKTRDFNGVYNVIESLGYEDFNPIYTEESTGKVYEKMLFFTEGFITGIESHNGGYYFLDSEIVLADQMISKVEYNTKSDEYILYFVFTYIDETSLELVETPLLFKVPVKNIKLSEHLFDGNAYIYKENSAIVKIDNNDILTQEAYEAKLAKIFELKSSENTFDQVATKLASYIYFVSDDTSRLSIITVDEKGLYFSYCELSANTYYSIAGLNLKLEKHIYNLETMTEEITLSISIQGNTRLLFTITSL